jgi:hypothetical protein
MAPSAAVADAVPVDTETGKVAGFTYREAAYNSYVSWSGWIYSFSTRHIGYGPGTPQAGVPFCAHAHTAVIAPAATGSVLLTVDQDAGGLPRRYAPSASMPMPCSLSQFDPVQSVTAIECPTAKQESGQFVVSRLEPLVPGFAVDIQLPVVADSPTTGTAAVTAMWVSQDVTLSNNNVLATVPVTVGAAPPGTQPPPNTQPPPVTQPVTKPLPKKLREYTKVCSLTPSVCKVKKRKVVVLKSGLCKLKGGKVVVKKRY